MIHDSGLFFGPHCIYVKSRGTRADYTSLIILFDTK